MPLASVKSAKCGSEWGNTIMQIGSSPRHSRAQFGDGTRAKFASLALVVSACGPPPRTSNVLSGNATSSYLDTVQHANPRGVNAAAVGLKIAITSRGDNTTERLIARVNEAQGVCGRSGAMVSCVIDKSIVERNCFQNRCVDSRKRWTLSISWRDAPGIIDPQVMMKISWPEML
jgi:hypothetical protein